MDGECAGNLFNKARGALMVVNEITSSVQAKGTKTVVATAVAALIAGAAGAAMAESTTVTVTEGETKDVTVTVDANLATHSTTPLISVGDTVTINQNKYPSGTSDAKLSVKTVDNSTVTTLTGTISGLRGITVDEYKKLSDNQGAYAGHSLIKVGNGKTLKLDGATLADNRFDMSRSIVSVEGGTLEVTGNSVLKGNTAAMGGALRGVNGTMKVTSAQFAGNTARANGGAIYVTGPDNGTLTVAQSEFKGNQAAAGGGKGGAIAIVDNKATYGGALFVEATAGKTTALTISDTLFQGNSAKKNGGAIRIQGTGATLTVTDTVFMGNTAGQGGAIDTYGSGALTFTDTVFTDNKATGWGGAIRLNSGDATFNVTEGKNLVYAGNQAGKNLEGYTNKLYGDNLGDFMYLNGNSTAKFDVAKNATLTVEDSIAALTKTVDGKNTITKSGEGKLVLGNLDAFVGDLTVSAGSLDVMSGIGSVDLAIQEAVNKATKDSKAQIAAVGTKVSVDGGAFQTMGDVSILHSVAKDAAGTTFEVQNGTLTLKSLTLGSKVYKDRLIRANEEAAADVTTYGVGTIHVEDKQNATIEGAITVGTGSTLNQTGTGTLTANSLTIAAGDTTNKLAAGQFNVDGTVVLNADSVNKGSINTLGEDQGQLTGMNGALHLNGGTFTNEGKMTLDQIVVGKGATLKTGVNLDGKASFMVFKDLTLENGSTLNLTALNSKTAETATANDQLTFNYGRVTMNGGTLLVADKVFKGPLMVAGSADVELNGTYAFDAVKLADAAKVKVGESYPADVTLAKVETAQGTNLNVVGGTLTVTDSLKYAGEVTIDTEGVLSLTSKAAGLDIAKGEYKSGADGKTITNAGSIVFTDAAGEFASFDKIAELKGKISNGNGLVKFGDKVTVKAEEVNTVVKDNVLDASTTEGKDALDKLDGVELQQFANVTVDKVGDTGLKGGSFGDVKLAAADGSLKVENGLTLNNGGTIVQDKNGKVAGVTLGDNATFTTTGKGAVVGAVTNANGKGALNVAAGDLTVKGESKVGSLTVAENATLVMDKAVGAAADAKIGSLTVADGFDVYGTLKAGDLVITGNANGETESFVLGSVEADSLTFTNESIVYVGSDADGFSKSGKLVVNKVVGDGWIFADPAWNGNQELALGDASQVALGELSEGTKVVAGQGSVVALGTTDADVALKAVAAAGHKVLGANKGQMKSALYVDGGKTYDEKTKAYTYKTINGTIAATGWSEEAFDKADRTQLVDKVTVQADNLMVVDMTTIDTEGKTAVFKNNVENEGAIFLAGAKLGDKINFSEGTYTATKGELLFKGDRVISATADKTQTDLFTLDWDKKKAAEYAGLETLGLIKAMYEQGATTGGSISTQFNNWLMSSDNGLTAAQVVEAGNDVAAIGATAGMASVTMDAMSAFNDTVGARTSILMPRAQQTTVWADVNAGRYEGKKVFDGAGYSSDIFGGVIGVDTQVSCGAVIGAALTVGQADTDSENTSAKTSMDSDFFGVSVYTSKTFGDNWNVAADVGYMQGSNDVDVKAYNLGKFSADTDAFTFGVRGEYVAKAGTFNIVPHAGLRWTRISTDSFEAGYMTDIDSMNVFQMPVGMTVAGNVAMGDWAVAPSFDLSFVPAFGDKDAEMTLGIAGVKASDDLAVRVIDSNPVQATLGVDAVNGNWAFGLNYKLGVGSDDRMSNAFSANVRYAF